MDIGKRKEDDELYIIELDERLEFGVLAIDSTLTPDINTQCYNGTACNPAGNATGGCTNGYNCNPNGNVVC